MASAKDLDVGLEQLRRKVAEIHVYNLSYSITGKKNAKYFMKFVPND